MMRFPDDLYTDIRIETTYGTKISIENGQLKQNKTKTDRGAMVRIFDGTRWYYHATTEMDHLQQTVDDLAKMATPDPSILEHPVVKCLEINTGRFYRYESSRISDVPNASKVALLDTYKPVFMAVAAVQQSRLYYLDHYVVKQIISSKGTDVTFDIQNCCVAAGYTLQEKDVPYSGGIDLYTIHFDELAGRQEQLRDELIRDLDFSRRAVPVQAGTYTCVLAPVVAGVFAHESFGHKSEADFMIGDEVMKREWAIGKQVGAPMLQILDSGLIEGAGFVPFDDEGNRAGEQALIRDGLLAGRLHSSYTAAIIGEKPTGNARAVSFEFEPIVRMTTTYIGAGRQTKDELIAGVQEGIYIDNLNHGSGMTTFTIAPRRAYMIRDGKIAEPVMISVITGNVMHTLHEIDGISDQVTLYSFALGGCGKMEQHPLPVSFGGPFIRAKGLHVQ